MKHLLWFFFSFLFLVHSAGANKYCSPNKEAPEDAHPVEKARQLIDNGDYTIWHLDDFMAARSYYEKALAIGEQCGNDSITYQAKIGLAYTIQTEGQYEKSYEILEELIPQIKNNKKLLALAYNQQGANEVKLGRHASAYDLQLKALQIFKDLKDRENIAKVHFGIGTNFFYQQQYEHALEQYLQSLEIWTDKKCKKGTYRAYRALGGTYGYLKQLDKAYNYTKKSLDIAKELDNKSDIAWTMINMGATEHDRGDNKKALQYFLSAKKLATELGHNPLRSYALEGITVVYKEEQKFDLALAALDESFAIARNNKELNTISGFYKHYADIYFELENFASYKEYIDKHIALKDSILNDELAASLGSLKKNFEVQEVERIKEIELLKKDNEIFRMRILLWGSIFGGIGLAALLLLAMFRYRNRHMIDMNNMLRTKNQQILQQNEKLIVSNKDLRQYAYIISHDLKEPLRNISSFTTLLKRKLPVDQDHSIKEYMGFITKGVNQMHTLLTDLLEYSKINGKSKKLKKFNAGQVVADVAQTLQFQLQKQDVDIQIDPLPDIHFDRTHFFQITQNLIANSLKFCGPQKLRIHISCDVMSNNYQFKFTDNGIGIDPEFHEKIFVVFQRLHSRDKYKGSGIGLSTCKKIISEYGGRIWVTSKPGEGATFYFTIPKDIQSPLIDSDTVSKQLAEEIISTAAN